MYESIESEAAEQEMAVAEYIRAVLRSRSEHTPANTQATSPGESAGEYAELRDRVDELEARVEDVEESLNQRPGGDSGSVLVKDDIDLAGDPSPGLEPWAKQKQTALELLRQRDEPVRKAEILDTVPGAEGIVDDTLWTEHVRPFIRDQGAELRGRQWILEEIND
jgi:hypothetical protein